MITFFPHFNNRKIIQQLLMVLKISLYQCWKERNNLIQQGAIILVSHEEMLSLIKYKIESLTSTERRNMGASIKIPLMLMNMSMMSLAFFQLEKIVITLALDLRLKLEQDKQLESKTMPKHDMFKHTSKMRRVGNVWKSKGGFQLLQMHSHFESLESHSLHYYIVSQWHVMTFHCVQSTCQVCKTTWIMNAKNPLRFVERHFSIFSLILWSFCEWWR